MSGEKMTVWITKWALGIRGIEKREVRQETHGAVSFWDIGISRQWLHKKDWHRTLDEAINAFEAMRQRRISTLQKQIDAMRSLRAEDQIEQ